MAFTDRIQTTKELEEMLIVKIMDIANENYDPIAFEGTNFVNDVFYLYPSVMLPAIFTMYEGSTFQQEPTRNGTFKVYTLTQHEGDLKSSRVKARDMAWKIAGALDQHIFNDALFTVTQDKAISLSTQGMSCYELTIKIEDY